MKPTVIITLAGLTVLQACSTSGMLQTAQRHEGLNERRDRAKLTRLIGVDPVRVPWCGAFMDYVARKNGKQPPRNSFLARSWLAYGQPVKAVQPGNVAVMRNHVFLITKRNGDRICGIGGNQSNAVQESCYRLSKIIGMRR